MCDLYRVQFILAIKVVLH